MNSNKEINIKFEEFEKRVHHIGKNVGKNSLEIKNISNNIENINENIEELNEDLKKDTFFSFFAANNSNYLKRGDNIVSIDKILFLCDPTVQTKIRIKVNATLHSYGSQLTSTLYLMINEASTTNAIDTQKVVYSGKTDHTFIFDYCGFLPKKDNHIFMRLAAGTSNSSLASVEVLSVNVEIYGKDVFILNRKNDFKVFISKDFYYLTKITPEGDFYSKIPTNDINLNSFTKIPPLIPANVSTYNNRYFPFNHTYVPNIIYNNSTNKYQIDHSVDFFVFCINYANTITSGTSNFVNGIASLKNWSARGFNYYVCHPTENGLYPRNLVFAYSGNLSADYPGRSLSNDTTVKNDYLSLNGKTLNTSWPSVSAVFAKNWEDNANQPLMFVAVNSLGETYFLPEVSSTYSVYLGQGRQTSAFLQDDGSITVYFNWMDKTYKRTLFFNTETNQYEATDEILVFKNVSEIIEGYSNGFFVSDLNRVWNYYETLDSFLSTD